MAQTGFYAVSAPPHQKEPMSSTVIDEARAELGPGRATPAELFRLREYVADGRNRDEHMQCKPLEVIAEETGMSTSAVRQGLWYWGWLEALDGSEAAPKPARSKRSPTPRLRFNPHGWQE